MTNQRRLRLMRAGGGVLAASALGLLAPAAKAAACKDLQNHVYVAGSSASKPFVQGVALALAAETPPISVVYVSQGSCVGVGDMGTTPTPLMGSGLTVAGTADAPIDGPPCDFDTAGEPADIGVSDVYAATCGPSYTLAADVKDFHGPVQSMNFVVPKDSTQTAISYDAAFLAFGFGADAGGGVPWTDPTVMEIRSATSGTQLMISAAIDLPVAKWKGHGNAGSGDVITSLNKDVSTSNATQTAIGILVSGDVEKNRNPATGTPLRALAYQHKDASCGYTPDSDSTTAFDKQNVRDGHYFIWGPLHMYAHASGGVPKSANVKKVTDLLTGAVVPDFDLIKVEAKAGVVPDCAMRVSRDTEAGPLSSYMPPASCECKFVAEATGTAPASCDVCTIDKDCKKASAPKCNYGFCEVQ